MLLLYCLSNSTNVSRWSHHSSWTLRFVLICVWDHCECLCNASCLRVLCREPYSIHIHTPHMLQSNSTKTKKYKIIIILCALIPYWYCLAWSDLHIFIFDVYDAVKIDLSLAFDFIFGGRTRGRELLSILDVLSTSSVGLSSFSLMLLRRWEDNVDNSQDLPAISLDTMLKLLTTNLKVTEHALKTFNFVLFSFKHPNIQHSSYLCVLKKLIIFCCFHFSHTIHRYFMI